MLGKVMEKKPIKRSNVPLCKVPTASSLSHTRARSFAAQGTAFSHALRPRYWEKLAAKAPEGLTKARSL